MVARPRVRRRQQTDASGAALCPGLCFRRDPRGKAFGIMCVGVQGPQTKNLGVRAQAARLHESHMRCAAMSSL